MAAKLKVIKLESILVEDRARGAMGDLEGLAGSIREKGVLQPITVQDLGGGQYRLLAGGRRHAASLLAEKKDIPCLIKDMEEGNEDLDADEVELIENIFRKGLEWHEEVRLVKKIHEKYVAKKMDWSIRKTAMLIDKGLGSVARYLQLANAVEKIPELAQQDTQDQAFKLLKNLEEMAIVDELSRRQKNMMETARTEAPGASLMDRGLANMLEIADANYRIGDVFGGMAELKKNGVIHMIECDPPYGIDLNEQKRGNEEATSTVRTYNEIPGEAYQGFLNRITKEMFRIAGEHCWLVFWYGPSWHHQVLTALKEAGWKVDDIPCIWYKRTGQTMQPSFNFARTYEPFFLARKGAPAILKQGKPNVFDFAPTPAQKKYHPTERPIELMEEIISRLVIMRQTVFVPFMGSGVTARACYKHGATVFGYDINKEYKDKFMLAVEADTRALDETEERAE